MNEPPSVLEQLAGVLHRRFGSRLEAYALPPPSFTSMQGEILAFDEAAGTLSARFPVLESQLNPYHVMQGGFLAAAVDNTLGPLSLLVAPPNVTRRLEMTYSRPVTLGLGYIEVHARFTGRSDRQVKFSAEIVDPQGQRMARARAEHWIVDE